MVNLPKSQLTKHFSIIDSSTENNRRKVLTVYLVSILWNVFIVAGAHMPFNVSLMFVSLAPSVAPLRWAPPYSQTSGICTIKDYGFV